MRFIASVGIGSRCRGAIAVGLLVLSASGASAQMVFDGNLLFNNNASGTLAGQFVGTAPAGAPCNGLTAAQLGTVTYTHNGYADPLLSGAIYQPGVAPNWQPAAGSPAFGGAVVVPNDGFFEQTCYRGAIGSGTGADWTQGWTTYDSTGASRSDLHLAGMPDPRPLAIYDNVAVYGRKYWSPDSNYLVRGQLRVKAQGSLTIAPGVVVFEERATIGTIVVERGGQIWAVGNACEPIIVTGDDAPGSMATGAGGGIVIHGRARTNAANTCAGDSAASEGGAAGYYGGNDDNDGSGALRYVRVEFAGREITPNNELNAFTFNACGANTKADYLEAFLGADDGFEWFGGAMSNKHLLAVDGTDDGYDWQMGSRCRAQFVIVRVSPKLAPSGGQFGDKGIEADNNEFNNDQLQCAGRSLCQLANCTFVGDKRAGALYPGVSSGVNFRRGTGGTFVNSIVTNFKTAALKVDDAATWLAHCNAPPAAPAQFCTGSVSANLVGTGRVLIASSAPNPFRNSVRFVFTLPRASKVTVDVFSADGRLVDTIADGAELPAGSHSLAWKLGRSVPCGMYFYRVHAGDAQATGKLVRVD